MIQFEAGPSCAEVLGCYSKSVEKPGEIRTALERAQRKVDEEMIAVVNIKTDYKARADTLAFSSYST